MAEDKNFLDKIRETASYYDKKVTDAINYVTPPPVRKIIGGIEALLPYQDRPDATEFIKNPSVKEGLELLKDTVITGAELTPLTYLASRGVTLPGKVAQEVTGGIRPVDDIINQKIVPKKDELLDIYTDKTKRKKRIVERAKVVKDKELNELINKINLHRAKFGGSSQEMYNNPYSDEIVSTYAKIYNSKNPFKMEYLISKVGDQSKSIRKKGKKKGLIDESTEDFGKTLSAQNSLFRMDSQIAETENFLINFKKNYPTATTLEARKATDDYLKNLSKDQRLRIFKRLEEEKILDDLNFSDLNKSTSAKIIKDPQIQKYLKDFELKNLPSDFDFVANILNPAQKKIVNNINKDVTSVIGANPAYRGIIRENLNRMIRYGLRDKGQTVKEVMASFEKQINNPKFLKQVAPLIAEKVKIQKYISGLNKNFGLNLDSVSLSHKKAVLKNNDLTFAIENLFIGSTKKNIKESAIQKKISSSTDIKEIKKLEGQIKDEKLLDPISPNYPSPDTVSADAAKKIKEGVSQAMTGDPLYYKKNGGMMNINDITGPLGKFSSQI